MTRKQSPRNAFAQAICDDFAARIALRDAHANERYVATESQAAVWARQEAAKHTTPESRAKRAAQEADMLTFCREQGMTLEADMRVALIALLTA